MFLGSIIIRPRMELVYTNWVTSSGACKLIMSLQQVNFWNYDPLIEQITIMAT